MSSRGVIDSWERIEAWLGAHAPQALATLNGPADPAAVAEAEQTVGVSLPADLKTSLARHDGAGQDQATPGRFALAEGYGLMSLELTVEDWRMLCELLAEFDEESMVGHWWHPQWIPVGDTITPVRLIVDQRPGPKQGQVGEFLDEDGGHFGRWASFADVLAHTADLLEGRVHDDRAVPRTVSGLLPLDPGRYLEDDAVAAAALAVSLGPGVFDPRVLRGPLPSAALLPLLPLLDDPRDEPLRLPVQADPDLVAAIEYATEDQLRPAVAALAGRKMAETGLDPYPEIVAAVRDAAQRQAGQVADDSPLGLVLRTLHAESNAAYADFREQSQLLTDSERQAWGERAGVAEGIEALLARPAVVAAYLLAGSPEAFDGRQEFLDDLAGVTIPADAVPQLERAEEQRYESMSQGPAWSGPRPSRRDHDFGGPQPIPGLGL